MALKNYHIHRSIDKESLKKVLGYTLILFIFFSMVLGYIRQSIMKAQLENEINRQTVARHKLFNNNQELKIERGALQTYSRIEREAKKGMGFIDPDPNQIIFIHSHTVLPQ